MGWGGVAWGPVMGGKQRCPGRRVGTGSAPERVWFLGTCLRSDRRAGTSKVRVPGRDRGGGGARGGAWGQAGAKFPPGGAQVRLGWLMP